MGFGSGVACASHGKAFELEGQRPGRSSALIFGTHAAHCLSPVARIVARCIYTFFWSITFLGVVQDCAAFQHLAATFMREVAAGHLSVSVTQTTCSQSSGRARVVGMRPGSGEGITSRMTCAWRA